MMERKLWFVCAAFAMALSGCGKTDPLAQARAACANAESEAQAQIAACTILIDSGQLDDGERSKALANRGWARGEGGEVTAALRDFEAALAANDENMRAVMGRASVLIDSGQLDAAEPLVQRLITSGELPGNAYFFAGDIAAQRGDTTGAITAYDAAIEANPRFASALAGRARMQLLQENYEEALVDYDAAIGIDPQLVPALAGRCWTRVQQENGDMAAARRDADEAVSSDPRNSYAQLCRGLLQLRAREWADARASYEAVLAVEPGNPTALFGRGVARRRGGDDAGSADMNQARDFDAHIAQAFDKLGVRTF